MNEACACPARKALAETVCWDCRVMIGCPGDGCMHCREQRAALSVPCPRSLDAYENILWTAQAAIRGRRRPALKAVRAPK